MKAFVGHSFEDRDEALVNKIITFLTQRNVQCQTGLKAQNKSVSAKVKALIDDNDFFIGIFTIDKPLEEKWRLFRKQNSGREFITSNWVIQESGYAIGRNKKIIFLVERGIYKFPELQGDEEYIPFTRDKAGMNEALIKLGDMILGIMPSKSGVSQSALSEPLKTETEEEKEDKSPAEQKEKDAIPYKELFDAFNKKDIKAARSIYEEKMKSKMEQDEANFYDCVIKRWEYCSGDADALKVLENIASTNNSSDAYWQAGMCYEFAHKYNLAAERFGKCIELAKTDEEKVNAIIRVSECYARDNKVGLAIDNLISAANKKIFESHYEKIYLALVKIAKDKQDDYLFVLFSEKALDINPVNTTIRFELAYKYGNTDKADLAIYHYKKMLDVYEDEGGLNNIGVEYANLDMKIKSISYYKKAIEKKNTLAYSNAAYKYIDGGFADEAEQLLKQADELSKEGKSVHQNIGYAKNKLEELKEAEKKKEKEILELAERKQKYKVRHAEAYSLINMGILPTEIKGNWHINNKWKVNLKVDNKNNVLEGYGEEEFEETLDGSFASLLGLGGGLVNPKQKIHKIRKIRISGTAKNFSGEYKIGVTEEKKNPVSLLDSPTEIYSANGLLIINKDLISIDTFEEDNKRKCYFEQWKAL